MINAPLIKKNYILILCFIVISVPSFAKETLYTLGPDKRNDATHAFFFDLLTQLVGDEFAIEIRPHQTQNRSIGLLATEGYYDVIWTAESAERDARMLKIDFPLFRGGLGVRGSIIRKSFEPQFIAIKNLDNFKHVRICQGYNWPDADILEYSGLKVYRAVNFKSMLDMVIRERCDAIPLSTFEGHGEMEVASREFDDLMFTATTLLIYPQSYHFYVRKDNERLASLLEERLTLFEQAGEYDFFLSTHPLSRDAFPLNQYENSTKIVLKPGNKFLQENE